jgi:hypothetical protein
MSGIRQFMNLIETAQALASDAVTLGDLCEVKTNFEDADFWIVRRGTENAVGTPTREFNPQHIGIRIVRPDVLVPTYAFYLIQFLHQRGTFKQIATGTLRLVNIKTTDVKSIVIGGR